MDLFSLWEDLVTYIKSNDSEYSEMFELHLYPVSLSGSVLTISTDHTLPKYQVAWLANVYSRKLESYILKTKNQQITIQVDNYRPPKITPNDGPGPVSAHAPAKDMEREKARNVVPPAPSPAPFPEGGIPSPRSLFRASRMSLRAPFSKNRRSRKRKKRRFSSQIQSMRSTRSRHSSTAGAMT